MTQQPEPQRTTLTSTSAPRVLTVEERAKVRRDLDAVFDDSAGMYLDGATDRTIADKHKLPWASVAAYREAAYGPLRSDPEFEALKSAVGVVRQIMDDKIRSLENAQREDRAAARQALADGQRAFDKWQKDMNERLDASTSALKSAADEMRGELVKIQNRINQQAQARGLRI